MKYDVTVAWEAEGWIRMDVEADSPGQARELARERAKAELSNAGVLGPRHTPDSVKTDVVEIEPA
jgi:hypothetical protein